MGGRRLARGMAGFEGDRASRLLLFNAAMMSRVLVAALYVFLLAPMMLFAPGRLSMMTC